jgi:hypothetical protein
LAEIRNIVLPSTSRAVPLKASWPVWPYCMFNHACIHNCDWNFWHCSWSHAESPTTVWICLRLQVELRKGERTLVCLLGRTSLYLWIAFSTPHTDGGRSSLHCVGFSAWEDGQSPKIVRDLTIYTILWSRMNVPLAFASSFPEPRIYCTLCPVCSVMLSNLIWMCSFQVRLRLYFAVPNNSQLGPYFFLRKRKSCSSVFGLPRL